jgi:topoisomerase IV subunit B
VGVSVVNALSCASRWVKRGGRRYEIAFAGGDKCGELADVGAVGQRNTGTSLRFWPDPAYFESRAFRFGA